MAYYQRKFDWQLFKIRTKERLRRLYAWTLGFLLIAAIIVVYLWWRYESIPNMDEQTSPEFRPAPSYTIKGKSKYPCDKTPEDKEPEKEENTPNEIK